MSENSITFPVLLDTVSFRRKPQRTDISSLKTRFTTAAPTLCTPKQFAEAMAHGQTCTPAVLQGGAKAENWVRQQLFCIDIDNKTAPFLTVKAALERCHTWGIPPFLIYATFSHTEETPKYRICFLCDIEITDGAQRDKIQNGFLFLFPECDISCKNRDRLFFGGKENLYTNFTATFAPLNVEFLNHAAEVEQAEKKPKQNRRKLDDLHAKAAAFDLLSYVEQDTGCSSRRVGRLAAIDPCPICGHKHDFFIYPDTNTFSCFGANGMVNGKHAGGTIIDYLMHTRNLDEKTAIETFKYDVLKLDPQQEKQAYAETKLLQQHNGSVSTSEQEKKLPPYIFPKYDKNGVFLRYEVSCPLLVEWFRAHYTYFWISDGVADKPQRYLYSVSGVYKLATEERIKGILRDAIASYDPTLLRIKDIEETAKLLFLDAVTKKPQEINQDERYVNFQNGLLCLETMELMPHDTRFLNTTQLPANWNSEATEAPLFMRYLNTLTDGDESKKRFLLQWMGCILSNIRGDKVKKAVFMYGKGDTGKSQLLQLCTRLLGDGNICSMPLQQLESDSHASYGLYGKRLFLDPDMKFMKISSLSVLKSLTGGDNILFNPKFKNAFTDTYKGFCWFVTNELPKFGGDQGDHVYNRFVLIACNNVIPPEQRDPMLSEKMYAEREAILNICMHAARDFLKNGRIFDMPENLAAELEAYKQANSPARRFFAECCTIRQNGYRDGITCKKLRVYYNEWAADNGDGFTLSPADFKQEVARFANVPVNKVVHLYNGNRFFPITLNDAAKIEFSNVPANTLVSGY